MPDNIHSIKWLFWLRQELKESLYLSVCPSGTSFSRKPNLHLSLSGLVKLYLSAPSPYFVWQTEPTHTLSCFFTNWHMQKVECRCRSKYPQSECELVIVLCGVSADFCWHVLAALSSPGCRVCGHCISQSEGRLGSLDQSEDDSRLGPGPLGAGHSGDLVQQPLDITSITHNTLSGASNPHNTLSGEG